MRGPGISPWSTARLMLNTGPPASRTVVNPRISVAVAASEPCTARSPRSAASMAWSGIELSEMWAWASIRPGISTRPPPAITVRLSPLAGGGGWAAGGEISSMVLPDTNTLTGPNTWSEAPSKTRTFSKTTLTRSSLITVTGGATSPAWWLWRRLGGSPAERGGGDGAVLQHAAVDDGGGHRAEPGDAAAGLLQVPHGPGHHLQDEAVLAGHVVGLDDLGGGRDQVVERLVVGGRVAQPDEGQDVQPEPARVDDGRVAGDHAALLQPADPFGDRARRHRHGPGQLGVTGPSVTLQGFQDAQGDIVCEISGHALLLILDRRSIN